MHGRVFIDQIAGYDDMIQLIPFSLILVGSGVVQDMGIGKKVVELAGYRISGGFSGRQYLCDTGVFRCVVKISHDQQLRRFPDLQQGITQMLRFPFHLRSAKEDDRRIHLMYRRLLLFPIHGECYVSVYVFYG